MVDVEQLRRLYVDEQLSTTQIADRVGMSPAEVWQALTRAGVRMRQRGVQPRLSEDDLRRWYQDEGLSTVEIARRTGMSTSGVHAALVRAGIPRRPLGGPQLPIDDQTLERLYVAERIELEELAARFGAAAWAVRRRLGQAGIARPAGAPPGGDRAMPPHDELERLYVAEQGYLLGCWRWGWRARGGGARHMSWLVRLVVIGRPSDEDLVPPRTWVALPAEDVAAAIADVGCPASTARRPALGGRSNEPLSAPCWVRRFRGGRRLASCRRRRTEGPSERSGRWHNEK